MANLQECLKYAVGLSQNTCVCLPTAPSNADKSLSGYYLDDMSDGVPLSFPSSQSECGQGNVWDLLDQARVQGIQEFQTGFLANSMQYAGQAIQKIRTQVGDDKHSSVFSVSTNYCGIVVRPARQLRGTSMNLYGFYATMGGNQALELKIFRSDNLSTPILTQPFTSQNNTKVYYPLTNPITLRLNDDAGNDYKYYFVYERLNNVLPMNNVFDCGCGTKINSWNEYLVGKGFNINSLNDLPGVIDGADAWTYGLQLDISISCDATQWMCNADLDYMTNAYARVIAKAVQLYSINKLIQYLLTSTAISRITVMPKDGLIAKFKSNQDQINGNMQWLGVNMLQYARSMSDCFTCPANSVFNKQPILI